MAIQNSYATNIPAGKAGHIADMTAADIISRSVETAGGIDFGKAVAQGTNDKGCIAFAGSGFLGIAVRDRSVTAGTDKFAQYDSARILKKGPIWVQASVAVAAGDPVYLTSAGVFTNAASGNVQIPNARWDTSTSGAALAKIFIK